MRQNNIYLAVLDESIDDRLAGKFQAYAEAFFHGVPVKLFRPGAKLKEKPSRNGKAVVKAIIPEDLLTEHEIPTRDYQGIT
eukprot:CAMPEP_0170459582 /NCGR_PEP_ID=MMETSP0123-20130129/6222_1 /TAXON_ID=182087 /ORGANISM="Favella ehrenbergii, Strain Fehren 1" /LENGTH=80 /DNA_ID=CAMNT_0010724215 /DNA_START=304 /DNA_END=546 /DNA_ORIENTATION=-